MIVSELVELLKQRDPNLRVFVQGYEWGFHDVELDNISENLVELDHWKGEGGYGGPHERVGRIPSGLKLETIKGLLFHR